jgi:hypothetical protein
MWTVVHMIRVRRLEVHGRVCHGYRLARRLGYDRFEFSKTIVQMRFSQTEQCGYFGAGVSRLWARSYTNANSNAHTDAHPATDGYAAPDRNANRRAYSNTPANSSAHTDAYTASHDCSG